MKKRPRSKIKLLRNCIRFPDRVGVDSQLSISATEVKVRVFQLVAGSSEVNSQCSQEDVGKCFELQNVGRTASYTRLYTETWSTRLDACAASNPSCR